MKFIPRHMPAQRIGLRILLMSKERTVNQAGFVTAVVALLTLTPSASAQGSAPGRMNRNSHPTNYFAEDA